MYFGKPLSWKDKLKDHYNTVKGWDFKLFTDMDVEDGGNFEVIKMSMKEFSKFVSEKFGIDYDLHLTPKGPYPLSKHIYDLWPTQGVLFEGYHRGYKWWAHGCSDSIFGDIDSWLDYDFDIFGNDPNAICGPFSVYRNTPKINNLFKEIPGWKQKLEGYCDTPMDEHDMTEVVRKAHSEGRVNFKSGFLQGHPDSKNITYKNGKVYDNNKEVMCFHFNRTKEWPI